VVDLAGIVSEKQLAEQAVLSKTAASKTSSTASVPSATSNIPPYTYSSISKKSSVSYGPPPPTIRGGGGLRQGSPQRLSLSSNSSVSKDFVSINKEQVVQLSKQLSMSRDQSNLANEVVPPPPATATVSPATMHAHGMVNTRRPSITTTNVSPLRGAVSTTATTTVTSTASGGSHLSGEGLDRKWVTQSLFYLEMVITALNTSPNGDVGASPTAAGYVPYRNSPLTNILK
jgi:hypothetical protein